MGFRPCWCPTPFPSPSTYGCFPFTLLRLPLDFISLFFTAAVSAPRHQPSSRTRAWDGHRATVDSEEEFYIHTYAHNTYVHMHIGLQGPSIKYVTLFLANFDPPFPCHTLSHISDPPIFIRPSTKIPDKSPLYKFYLNCSWRFLSGGSCSGWFLYVPPSVTIHLLQQKVKHHFRFHVSYV